MQNVDKKKARRPERQAHVTTKKGTPLSPELVPKCENHNQIIPCKTKKRKSEAVYLLPVFLVAFIAMLAAPFHTPEAEAPQTGQAEAATQAPEPTPQVGYFAYETKDGDPQIINMEELTQRWAVKSGTEVRYQLTDAERYELAQIVTAEAEGEPLAGKMAICQCLLQAAEDDNVRPTKAADLYYYAESRPNPTDDALLAVSYVFDLGLKVASEPIKYFYNPDKVASLFHESQRYVLTINNHRFFAESKK